MVAVLAHAVGVPLHVAAWEHHDVGHVESGEVADHVHTGPLGHSGGEDPDHPTHSALDHLEPALVPAGAALDLDAVLPPAPPIVLAPLTCARVAVARPDPPPPKPPPRRPGLARAPPTLLG